MRRVLIAFTTREGQTHTIAHHVARQLEDQGCLTRLIDIAANEPDAGADTCDAAILAGSIHRGSYDAALAGFLMRHGPSLRAIPSAFLSVSLTAASDKPRDHAALDEITQRFLAEVGWTPDRIKQIAGALHDREMNTFERAILHTIVDSQGAERHPSGNTEFTNWADLDAFIREFAATIPAPDAAGGEPEG